METISLTEPSIIIKDERPSSAGSHSYDLSENGGNSIGSADLSLDDEEAPHSFSVSQQSGLSLSTYNDSQKSLGGEPLYSTSLPSSEHKLELDEEDYVVLNTKASITFGDDLSHQSNGNQGFWRQQLQAPSVTSKEKPIDPDDTFIDDPENSPSESANMSPRTKIIRFAAKNEVRTYTPNPDEFKDNPDEVYFVAFSRGGKLRNFFVVNALPFTYGATSSLTSLYFFIDLVVRYGLSIEIIGTLLASAYLCRIIFTSITRYAPKTFVVIGSISALLGFTIVLISQRPDLLSDELAYEDDGLTLFIIGSVLTNCNETISAMQMFIRDQHLDNVKVLGSYLKVNFLTAKLARVCTFCAGGIIHNFYGLEGLAVFGACMVSLQLLFLISYLILDIFRIPFDPNNAYGEDFIDWKPRIRLTCSIRAARGKRRMFKSAMSKIHRTLTKYYPTDLPPSMLGIVIPICSIGRSLSSTCIWGSSGIIISKDFTGSFLDIGMIFAGGAATDLLISTIMLTKTSHDYVKKWVPSPRNLYIVMMGITFSSILVAIPLYPVFITGFILYSVFSSSLRLILTELQGSSSNSTERLLVQIPRRILTATAIFSLPILYNLHPMLPVVLGLWFALISTIALTTYTCCCQPHDEGELDNINLRKHRGAVIAAKNRPSKRPERNLIYPEQVMLARLMKGKDV